MLPGTMYPKKTYGKSLFIGEFKHAVGTAVTTTTEQPYVTTAKKQDTQPVENEDEESLPENPSSMADDINVSRTLTFEVHDNEQKLKGDQVKANLKKPPIKTGLTAQSPASKAFFTPTKEEESNNSEQVLDLPVIKEEAVVEAELTAKPMRKKKISVPPSGLSLAARKQLSQKVGKFSTKFKTFPKSKQQDSKQKKLEGRDREDNEKDENEEKTASETEEKLQKETRISTQEESEHFEFSTEDYTSPDPKSILIKPIDFPGYPQDAQEGNSEPSMSLEPDAVADMKRDLAEKGIITLPPQYKESAQPTDRGPERDYEDVYNRPFIETYSDEGSENEDSEVDPNLDQSSDFAGDKSDKKESFKTNKSFEIRRLQAKAEREKEEKKKALYGTKVSKLTARIDHVSKSHDHSRVPLKSALKSLTPSGKDDVIGSNSNEARPSKSRASVRIREPEYDIQEYMDVEYESDSGDSNRPNSSLMFSEFTISSDLSSDSSLGTSAGDEAFRDLPYSDEDDWMNGNDIHQLYDEIDELSPSRAGFYGTRSRNENFSRTSQRELVESRTSHSTARSSLHVLSADPNQPQSQQQHLQSYNDKPMHLFDAMRHEQSSSERKRAFNPDEKVYSNSEASEENTNNSSRIGVAPPRNEKRRNSLKENRTPPKSSNVPVAFISDVHPVNGQESASSKKKWKERVVKLFETSYTNRSAKSNPEQAENTASNAQSESTGKLRWYRSIQEKFDCNKMSFSNLFLCIALPTTIITIGLLLVVLFTTGTLPA